MVQALPRYCLRCGTPIRTEMQHCANCGLSIETMLRRPGLQQVNDDPLLKEQPNWNVSAESVRSPRFSPSSPLPPELEGGNTPDTQDIQQAWFAPQYGPRFASMQRPSAEDWSDPVLAHLPENPGIFSTKTTPCHPDNRQSETDGYDHAALQEAIALTPRKVQPKDSNVLIPPPVVEEARPVSRITDEFTPLFQPSLTSPLVPEPEEEQEVQLETPQTGDSQPALTISEATGALVVEPEKHEPQLETPQTEDSQPALTISEATGTLVVEPEKHEPQLETLQTEDSQPALTPSEEHVVEPEKEQAEPEALPTPLQTGDSQSGSTIPEVSEEDVVEPEEKQAEPEALSTPLQTGERYPDRSAPQKLDRAPRSPITSPLVQPDRWNEFRRKRRRDVALIILAAFWILATGGGYLLFSNHLPGLNNLQPAARTTSLQKTTIDVQATAAADVANTNPYVSGGKLVLADTLNTGNAEWEQDANCIFKDGSYHVTATTIQACALSPRITLTNFVLEFKVNLLQGDVGGVFFRKDKLYNGNNAYLLDFDSQGNYQLWNYSVSGAATSIDYGASNSFSTGYNQSNTIALVVLGSSITLYVNGQMVKHFIDTTHSSGGLSLISSEYSQHTAVSEAAYSDMRIWQL